MTKGTAAHYSSVGDYEIAARKHLSQDLAEYIYFGTESETTLSRNIDQFSRLQLRRRVLTGIESVKSKFTYFDGQIKSELPFFPACINTSQLYSNALPDILALSKTRDVPMFVSEFAVKPPFEFAKLPTVFKNAKLMWQIYVQRGKIDQSLRQAQNAKSLGYAGVVVTVDAEQNVKLRNTIPTKLMSQQFIPVSPREVKKLRERTTLPFIVKGVMTGEDAVLAIESGADGVVVSNHGGRVLDYAQASIEVLPEIVGAVKSKKSTRKAEIFHDGGIRRGTDILKALALGARGCLLGRAIFWGLVTDHKNGVQNVVRILEEELVRAAILCGVSDLSKIKRSVVVLGN